MRIALISDTHVPRRARTLPQKAWSVLGGVDFILHAGDMTGRDFYEELILLAPVYAVAGNVDDLELVLPAKATVTAGSLTIGIFHDHGSGGTTLSRVKRVFQPGSHDLVLFGHSHVPHDEREMETRCFNPGSPTHRRRQPHKTMGLLDTSAVRVD